ncbi:hypothetical protein NVP1081O_055 [Vibrio phage 1.081.O._10N.286.52.C2]|nr:hypothetical protein NVP1081O_055 [Vibrio phage 1.081.O._10N.286.52.C2]
MINLEFYQGTKYALNTQGTMLLVQATSKPVEATVDNFFYTIMPELSVAETAEAIAILFNDGLITIVCQDDFTVEEILNQMMGN